MEWWWLILTALAWFLGIILIRFGFLINKEEHEKKSVFDYANNTPALGDFSIFGFIFDIVFSLTIGVIMRYSPWWMVKALTILVACGFFYLGFLAIMKMIV